MARGVIDRGQEGHGGGGGRKRGMGVRRHMGNREVGGLGETRGGRRDGGRERLWQ